MKKLLLIICTLFFVTSCTKEVNHYNSAEEMSAHELMNDIVDSVISGNYDLDEITKDIELLEEKAIVEEKQLNYEYDNGAIPQKLMCNSSTLRGLISYRTGVNRVSKQGIGVEIESAQGQTYVNTITDTDTPYNFCHSFAIQGQNTVSMISPHDWMNGVSTLDIVYILRHILRIQTFTYGEQLVAADVNRDNAIDNNDIDDLRDLILGITIEINNNSTYTEIASQGNKSWLFVSQLSIDDETYVLNNYPEFLEDQEFIATGHGRTSFTQLYTGGYFTINSRVAVKIGDLNFSAIN